MVEITRSKTSVLLHVVAAALVALSTLMAGLGFAILTQSTVHAYDDLRTAFLWLLFAATAAGLGAVATAAWETTVTTGWQQATQLIAATGASLLIAIGALVSATGSPFGSDGGSVVSVVGIGGWFILILTTAAQRSIAEREHPTTRTSDLWLIASGALLLIAVAVGLPAPEGSGRGLPIADSILFLLAFAGLATALHLFNFPRSDHQPTDRNTRLRVARPGRGLSGRCDRRRVRVRAHPVADHVPGGLVHPGVPRRDRLVGRHPRCRRHTAGSPSRPGPRSAPARCGQPVPTPTA